MEFWVLCLLPVAQPYLSDFRCPFLRKDTARSSPQKCKAGRRIGTLYWVPCISFSKLFAPDTRRIGLGAQNTHPPLAILTLHPLEICPGIIQTLSYSFKCLFQCFLVLMLYCTAYSRDCLNNKVEQLEVCK